MMFGVADWDENRWMAGIGIYGDKLCLIRTGAMME